MFVVEDEEHGVKCNRCFQFCPSKLNNYILIDKHLQTTLVICTCCVSVPVRKINRGILRLLEAVP